jgi:hypothetical protein
VSKIIPTPFDKYDFRYFERFLVDLELMFQESANMT